MKRSRRSPTPEVRRARDQGGKEKEKGKEKDRDKGQDRVKEEVVQDMEHSTQTQPDQPSKRLIDRVDPSDKQDLNRIENELKEKALRQKVIKSRDQKVGQ